MKFENVFGIHVECYGFLRCGKAKLLIFISTPTIVFSTKNFINHCTYWILVNVKAMSTIKHSISWQQDRSETEIKTSKLFPVYCEF